MKKIIYIAVICSMFTGLYACSSGKSQKQETQQKEVTPADLGWKLGAQAYTFRKFTFFEAVDKIKELGMHYVEAYPGQDIGGSMDGKMGIDMDQATRDKILSYLKKQDVHLMAYGVITPKTHDQWDALFAFADDMGISTITSEPPQDEMSYVSKLCDKYNIDVAIHNHPQPSRYWNPDTLLAAIQGQSSHIGSCADLGHWVRSGLDPVESLKTLSGHIKELHIKDVDAKSPEAEDTVWGTGVIDMKAVMKELKKQNFKGMFSIEYESDPENNMPQIRKSINYLDQVVANLNKEN